jgi:uncharacterized repeat protein (TIGR03806 family)
MKNYITPVVIGAFFAMFFITSGCNQYSRKDTVIMDITSNPFERISDYKFFKDATDFTKPNNGVIPYKIVNSMFNDYAERANFFYIPEGKTLYFDTTHLLNLPPGSCLINVVYYYKDYRNHAGGRQLVETQLLMRKQTGWELLNYLWNDDQKDALLTETGEEKLITWIDKNGLETQAHYIIPNKDECKHCHWLANRVTAIGTKAGNLNLDVDYSSGRENQLDHWIKAGLIKHFAKENASKYQDWTDTSLLLEERARNYLGANCGYCHSPHGTALRSGLFLDADNYNMQSYGVCKPVISKGKATCNLKYDILPGSPAESAMVCRIASTDYGIKMPELGRTLVDTAGVSLITEWIAQLKGGCNGN